MESSSFCSEHRDVPESLDHVVFPATPELANVCHVLRLVLKYLLENKNDRAARWLLAFTNADVLLRRLVADNLEREDGLLPKLLAVVTTESNFSPDMVGLLVSLLLDARFKKQAFHPMLAMLRRLSEYFVGLSHIATSVSFNNTQDECNRLVVQLFTSACLSESDVALAYEVLTDILYGTLLNLSGPRNVLAPEHEDPFEAAFQGAVRVQDRYFDVLGYFSILQPLYDLLSAGYVGQLLSEPTCLRRYLATLALIEVGFRSLG